MKLKNAIGSIFKDLFAIDFVFIISVATSIIYGLVYVQEKYDKAVAHQHQLFEQLNSNFFAASHVEGIRIEDDQEPEELVFLVNKSVTVKVDTNKNKRILIIQCSDSQLPK